MTDFGKGLTGRSTDLTSREKAPSGEQRRERARSPWQWIARNPWVWVIVVFLVVIAKWVHLIFYALERSPEVIDPYASATENAVVSDNATISGNVSISENTSVTESLPKETEAAPQP